MEIKLIKIIPIRKGRDQAFIKMVKDITPTRLTHRKGLKLPLKRIGKTFKHLTSTIGRIKSSSDQKEAKTSTSTCASV